ncbi:MAG: PAS domain-containing protein [Phycisphaerae bacterium]|nr:PAS domain-containing protein [Phycisphaerae bacterium]
MVMTDTGRSPPLAPPIDPGAVWQALVLDSGSAVAIVDVDGVVRFGNAAFDRMLGLDSGSSVGRRLHEVFPPTIAEERAAIVREVATQGQQRTLQGMVGATWRHTTFRPLGTGPDGKATVLIVCTSGAEDARSEDGAPVATARTHDLGDLSMLTTRELEILKLIARGLSTADIGKSLHRSVKTIEWHRVALGNKLGVSNRVELARIAIRAGLVRLDKA